MSGHRWQSAQSRLALLAALCLFFISTPCWPANHGKISFSCAIASPDTPLYRQVETIYRDAFAALGYEFEMIPGPNLKRSLTNAKSGGTDGDCARASTLNDFIADSHLVRVNIKIAETSVSIWSTNPNLVVLPIEKLKASSHVLAYPRGLLMAEKFIADNQLTNTQAVNTHEAAIKMLQANRLDLVIASTEVMVNEINHLNPSKKLYNLATVVRYEVIPYLNEKHRALVPSLEKELKKRVPPEGITVKPRQQ